MAQNVTSSHTTPTVTNGCLCLRHMLLLIHSIRLLHDCGLNKESTSAELGLATEQNRCIAYFNPLQTKARCAAEDVQATTLPHPWIGSEQGTTNSHEDHRFSHFLDHSHPSLDDEILACHTAVTARDNGDSHQHKPD